MVLMIQQRPSNARVSVRYRYEWWQKANVVLSDFVLSNNLVEEAKRVNRRRNVCRERKLGRGQTSTGNNSSSSSSSSSARPISTKKEESEKKKDEEEEEKAGGGTTHAHTHTGADNDSYVLIR